MISIAGATLIHALPAKIRRRLRAAAAVRAARQGTPYWPTCPSPGQCDLHRGCALRGVALATSKGAK